MKEKIRKLLSGTIGLVLDVALMIALGFLAEVIYYALPGTIITIGTYVVDIEVVLTVTGLMLVYSLITNGVDMFIDR